MKRYDWKTVIRPAGGAVLMAALLAGSAAPAGADWLVTREGGRVETRGAWEVKGKLVVFHTAAGTLASLRLSEVDLDASRAATEQGKTQAAAPKPKPARKPSIVSLTDKDFRKVEPPAPAAPAAGAGEAEAAAQAAAPEEPAPTGLAVANWERGTADDGHAVITGTLQNTSGATATDVQLAVALYDETGRLIVRGLATVDSPALPAGQQSGFRADFPGFYGFAEARFEPSSVNLSSGPAAPSAVNSGG